MTIYSFKIVWETPRDNAEQRLSGTRNQRRQILFEMVDILHGCTLIKATFLIHRNTFLPCGSLCDVFRRLGLGLDYVVIVQYSPTEGKTPNWRMALDMSTLPSPPLPSLLISLNNNR